jgi:hypothetical protein
MTAIFLQRAGAADAPWRGFLCPVRAEPDEAPAAVFAARDIAAGAPVYVDRWPDLPAQQRAAVLRELSAAQVRALPEAERTFFLRRAWQLGDDLFAGPAEPASVAKGESRD